jgi:hypothetical protein
LLVVLLRLPTALKLFENKNFKLFSVLITFYCFFCFS